MLLVYSTSIDSSEVLRLSGVVLPIVELSQINQTTFLIHTNSSENFRYEISNKVDFKVEEGERLITSKKD